MEGMPRLPMLAPEAKIPVNQFDDEFSLKIKEYILIHFQDDPNNFDQAIQEIVTMKKQISNGYLDVETTCTLKRYYAQLIMMKNRFPMEEGDPIKILFSWYDRAMDMPHAATYDDIGFELACVMYNIGAVHAAIAVNEMRDSEDSIKNAFMHFQYAAWPLQHLRDKLNASKYASVDFDKDLLTFYVNVLLGQAQECLVEKSLIDHRSNLVVAKLTVHLRDLYQECLRHLDNSSLSDIVSSHRYKQWLRTCAIKSEMYGAIAMIYMGLQADENKKMGERLGYYSLAGDHQSNLWKLNEKEDRETMKAAIDFLCDVVMTKLTNAKKENEFIYYERIPSADELRISVEGLCKVRPLSFDPLDPSVGGEDIFGSLLPPAVLKAVSEYEEEKASLKREVLERIAQKDAELESFLHSLRIDELELDPSPSDARLPDLLLERNATLTTQLDAIPNLLENLQKVDDMAREADARLTELNSRLLAVDLPELTSDDGYKAVSKEIERLTDHHHQARSNNVELHKAIADHTTNLHLLSLPLAELSGKLITNTTNPGSTKEGMALRHVLDKTREMQTQRSVLVQRLCEEMNADNVTKKLLAERSSDHKITYIAELKKHEELIKYIDANLTAQAKILSVLTEANADFSEYRKQIKAAANSRSEQIMALVTAFDVYNDVCNKAVEGKRFYTKLLDRVDKMSQAVGGIETAYSSERKKFEVERRALEEKMLTLRRAHEARDALADFSLPINLQIPSPALSVSSSSHKTGRPRLGDYMEFYRNKIYTNTGGVRAQHSIQPPSTVSGIDTASYACGISSIITQPVDANCSHRGNHSRIQPASVHQTSIYQPHSTVQSYTLPSIYHPYYNVVQPVGPKDSTHVHCQSPMSPGLSVNSQISLSQPNSVPVEYQQIHSGRIFSNQSLYGQASQSSTTTFVVETPIMTPHAPSQSLTQILPPQHSSVNTLNSVALSPASQQISLWTPYHVNPNVNIHPTISPISVGRCKPSIIPVNVDVQTTMQHSEQSMPVIQPLGNGHMPFISAAGGFSSWHKTSNPASIIPSPWHSGAVAYKQQDGPSTLSGSSTHLPGTLSDTFVSSQSIIQQQTSSVDLLSSLLGDLQLPPAIQPQKCAIGNQRIENGLQNTTNQSQTDASFPVNTNSDPLSSSKFDATISQVSVLNTSINSQPEVKLQTVNLSTTTLNEIHISGSGQGPIISQNQRPAAAVIPIQQQSVCTQAEKPVLSMATASSVSFAPQINPVPVDAVHNLPVSDVVDPVKFQLGIGDRTRLEKRLLHESIRKEGPRPPLDPTDPLNMLDPFWNTR